MYWPVERFETLVPPIYHQTSNTSPDIFGSECQTALSLRRGHHLKHLAIAVPDESLLGRTGTGGANDDRNTLLVTVRWGYEDGRVVLVL